MACQCIKLQLAQLGLDTEFLPCEIQVKDHVWEWIRHKYWHGRDTYYLPVCKWNAQFLMTGTIPYQTLDSSMVIDVAPRKQNIDCDGGADSTMEIESNVK